MLLRFNGTLAYPGNMSDPEALRPVQRHFTVPGRPWIDMTSSRFAGLAQLVCPRDQVSVGLETDIAQVCEQDRDWGPVSS